MITIALLLSCSEPVNNVNLIVIRGYTMGTGYTVKISDNPKDLEPFVKEVTNDIENLLIKINQQMSTYLDSSEISRFNYFGKTDWFSVSTETAEIVKQALEISEKSDGAFDITVGPLVNLWGFGPPQKDLEIPSQETIRDVTRYTGYHKISVRLSPPSLKKEIPELYCDLAAIAKGYGVDKIAGYLDSIGVSNYLIEIGGEIKAKGKNNQSEAWRIGVETPDNRLAIQRVVSLINTSMATSGDYRNYFQKGGIRYSHIIDPRTGEPVKHKLASVTLIHDLCSYADAMATAISVLGPDDGYKLALKEDLAALLIIREENGLVEKMTPRFRTRLSSTD
jgi:thiamine biosynthesis lipoprotein